MWLNFYFKFKDFKIKKSLDRKDGVTIDGDSLLQEKNGYCFMENELSDKTLVYEWSIKIEKTIDTSQGINIGIASYPLAKEGGHCCLGSYDYSEAFKI